MSTVQTILNLPAGDGSVQSTRDTAGITTDSVYDLAGRLDRVVVNGLGTPAPQQITRYQYDEANRQTAVIDPLGDRTTFTYDDANHMLTSTGWLDASTGYTTRTAYNAAGQAKSTTDANERITRYVYDPAGRLASVILADGTADATTTAYEYNAAGQMETITDALDHITSFQYDHAGRQSAKVWPDSSTKHFGYDALGNQTGHQLADGQRFSRTVLAQSTRDTAGITTDSVYDLAGRYPTAGVARRNCANRSLYLHSCLFVLCVVTIVVHMHNTLLR